MSKVLYSAVLSAIGDRKDWEEKQRLWYLMRHNGIPRRNKPFPGAADLHFPLVDSTIDKFKPFYINAAFGTQKLATFTPMNQAQMGDAQAAAEESFDWLTRNKTNFEEELDATFDAMLLSGRTPMKVRWDNESGAVDYEAVDPIFFIVPKSTTKLQKASWVCHVKQISVLDYQLEPNYVQDATLIKRIRGGSERDVETSGIEEEKTTREGITYSKDDDVIILFEVYARDASGWIIHTFSPAAPEVPVRAPFRCPYVMQGKPFLPFVSFQFEVKDRGWYSPRGVAERLAPYETYASKCWNTKADSMEFLTKPLFTGDNPLAATTGNIRFRPGDFLPNIRAVEMPAPPVSLDQEMNNTRLIAQEAIQVPDFGTSEEGAGQSKTATEMNYVASFTGQGVQYRGRISFRSLSEVFRMSWALWVQFGGDEITYFASDSRKVLPMQAKADNFLIQPNGSADQWNKQQQLQRAVSRFQMLKGHPNINQGELVKSVLEADDPRLVKRMFIGDAQKQANEAEDEAMEIVLLMNGFPAAVMPGEDHQFRIRLITQKLQQLSQMGVPVDPMARQRLQEHMVAHMQMLRQENPSLGKQVQGAMMDLDIPSAPGAGAGATPLPTDVMGGGQGGFPGMGAPTNPAEAMAV